MAWVGLFGRVGSEINELKNAALALIRSEAFSWSGVPAEPNTLAEPSSQDGLINNLFLAAASVVILHECGHIALGHQVHTTLMHQQEREADAWAVKWILEQAPGEPQREFRTVNRPPKGTPYRRAKGTPLRWDSWPDAA